MLEHVVDTVLSFEGDRHHALRLLRAVKHRFGSTDELGPVRDDRARARPACPTQRRCSWPTAARRARLGRRAHHRGPPPAAGRGAGPRDAEPRSPSPRRSAQGVDGGRLALLLAVLEQRARLPLRRGRRATPSAVGGVRVAEPGADLGLALAVASSLAEQAAARRPGGVRRGRPRRRAAPGRTRPTGGWPRRPGSGFTPGGRARLGARAAAGHRRRIRVGTLGRGASTPCGLDGCRSPTAPAPDGLPVGRAAAGPPGSIAPMARPTQRRSCSTALAAVAPGQARCATASTASSRPAWARLIVVGDGPEVLNICSGGFLLDAAFSPQRLSELAKMDGAIILAPDASRIARANVHLVPNPNVPTSETGTRHRTAERVARSIDVPGDLGVARTWRSSPSTSATRSTSSSRSRACSTGPTRRCRRSSATGTASTRCRRRCRRSRSRTSSPSATSSACCSAPRWCGASPRRSSGYIVELGVDGRLVRLQLEELMGGVEDDRRLVIRDYFHEDDDVAPRRGPGRPRPTSTPTTCSTSGRSADALHLPDGAADLDEPLQPRGYRLLAKIPRLPEPVIEHIVDRFGNLQKIMRATIDDLDDVEGVGETRAQAIKDGLSPPGRVQHPRPLHLTGRPARFRRTWRRTPPPLSTVAG